MSKWYSNFLKENYHGDRINIHCIDEVISGASAVKGYQEFKKALLGFKQRNGEDLRKKVFLLILTCSNTRYQMTNLRLCFPQQFGKELQYQFLICQRNHLGRASFA